MTCKNTILHWGKFFFYFVAGDRLSNNLIPKSEPTYRLEDMGTLSRDCFPAHLGHQQCKGVEKGLK
jgi:hypothetical protein